MDVVIPEGTYVVAVSGGVDSMVLLDVLRRKSGLKLVIAHFDHGIRHDSSRDRALVHATAKQHRLPFVYAEGSLGANASESSARTARYAFLHRVMEAAGATAIITAHHQDDRIETALINVMRGTNRRGLTALKDSPRLLRPLLGYQKSELRDYARNHDLLWREDSTNSDERYVRNRVRHALRVMLSAADRARVVRMLDELHDLNSELDAALEDFLDTLACGAAISRKTFVGLPHGVAVEVLAMWLRRNGIGGYDERLLERLVTGVKTLAPGNRLDVKNGVKIVIAKDELALRILDR